MSSAVQDLLTILDLEPLEENLFRGRSPQVGWQRVFGGQVIGQPLDRQPAIEVLDEQAKRLRLLKVPQGVDLPLQILPVSLQLSR